MMIWDLMLSLNTWEVLTSIETEKYIMNTTVRGLWFPFDV